MNDTAGVLSLLQARGAAEIGHPGGSLLAHALRVSHRLARLSTAPGVQLAGLAHASYGTDGFRLALMDHTDRDELRALIGDQPEELVFRYGGCDRGRTWRALPSTGQVWSRFDGTAETLDGDELRAFVDLCIVIELDILERSAGVPGPHRDAFGTLFDSWRTLASPAVMRAADDVLGELQTTNSISGAPSTAL